MLTKDHRFLALYLIQNEKNGFSQCNAAAFVHGCAAPDYNLFTFLRREKKGRKLKGHNTENTRRYILRGLGVLTKKTALDSRDYFRLGIIMHYLADSFTYPHTEEYAGTLADHLRYEQKLHVMFTERLRSAANEKECFSGEIGGYIAHRRVLYMNTAPSFERDLEAIFGTCAAVLHRVLYAVTVNEYIRCPRAEGGGGHENPYNYRLV